MSTGQCIQPLPAALVAKLRAPQVIHSLAQALDEIVANSVDASATHIEVEVDVALLSLTVADDGCGISPVSLESVARRHCTSKLRNQKQLDSGLTTLGFKGEALASIAEVSLLQLTSKPAGTFETHIKLLKGGKVIKQGLALEQSHKTGTIVCVKDFLFNQPVRRRHFMQAGLQKEIDACRETLLRLALPHPAVTFTLTSKNPRRQLLHLPKGRGVTDVLPLIFGGQQQHSLSEVMYSSTVLSVQGYISIPPASSRHKHKQYLYVNNRHIRAGQIGKLITSLFKAIMLKLEQADEQQKRANQHYPAFALQISCPASSYDITSDPDKAHIEFADWATVLSAVQTAVLSAWHAVVGDKMLTELLHCQTTSQHLPAQTQPAATEGAKPGLSTTSSHFSPTQPSTSNVSGPQSPAAKRKRKWQQEPPESFTNQDDVELTRLFRNSGGCHTKQGQPSGPQARSVGTADAALGNSSRTDLPSADPPPSSRTAPQGLLARLQSSVKLKFASTGSRPEEEARQTGAVLAKPQAGHPTTHGRPTQSTTSDPASELKPSSTFQVQGPGRLQAPPAGTRAGANDAAAAGSMAAQQAQHTASSHHTVQARASAAGTADQRHANRHHHHRKRRATSAPPHHRSHRRTAHTNPVHSLHTHRSPPTHSCKKPGQKPSDSAEPALGTVPAETAQVWLQDTQARQRHTVSGVCGQLRQKLSAKSVEAPLSSVFRQKRPNSAARPAQQPEQLLPGRSSCLHAYSPAGTLITSPVADVPAMAHQPSLSGPTSQPGRADNALPGGKRVRFDLTSVEADGAPLALHSHSRPAMPSSTASAAPETPIMQAPHQQAHSLVTQAAAPSHEPISNTLRDTQPAVTSAQTASTDAQQQINADCAPQKSVGHSQLTQQPSLASGAKQPNLASDAQQQRLTALSSAQHAQQTSLAAPSVTELLQSWSNPSMHASSNRSIADLPSVCAGAMHTVLPSTITRADFQQGIALRQLENKFIALVCNGGLSVVDQHAADERVRLEKLRAAVLGSQGYISSVAVVPPVRMDLSGSEVQMVESYRVSLEHWGWRWKSCGSDASSVALTHFGCVLDAPMNAVDLQVYFHQLAETHGSLLLPPAVIRILNAKACRSAIMFGDPLLPTECAQLVSSLKATQLCFSCAHGRPTMAPLVKLQAFHNQLSMRKDMPSLLARSSGKETISLKQRLHSLLAKS